MGVGDGDSVWQDVLMRDEALVAIVNDPRDLALAREQGWYRIPVSSAERWLKGRWPPRWLAFYQTKVFGEEAYGVHYYAPVLGIDKAFRWQLLPEQPKVGRGTGCPQRRPL